MVPQQSRASPTPPPPPSPHSSIVRMCYELPRPSGFACWNGGPATPTLGICVLGRWARGQLLTCVMLNVTHFSRQLAELTVRQEVMSGNSQKALEQGPTEKCTVCHTVYPQCNTCSRYGRRGMHPLDQEKARNAHDNPGFLDDSNTQQSHWRQKNQKGIINFHTYRYY